MVRSVAALFTPDELDELVGAEIPKGILCYRYGGRLFWRHGAHFVTYIDVNV